jgi:hypothetical protein
MKLPTIMQKLGCSKNTRDHAIADLTRADLLVTEEHYDPELRTGRAANRRLNIGLLQKEVAKAEAENQPAVALKKIEKQTRKILKRLENTDSVTYGPIAIEEAKTMTGCLERLATFTFTCKAKRNDQGAVQVTVSRTDRAPAGEDQT